MHTGGIPLVLTSSEVHPCLALAPNVLFHSQNHAGKVIFPREPRRASLLLLHTPPRPMKPC